jgi:hypothetical protein
VTTLPVICLACTRYDGLACSSFPDGIPEAIVRLGGDHRVSIAGELPFDRAPGAAADEAFADWLAFHSA